MRMSPGSPKLRQRYLSFGEAVEQLNLGDLEVVAEDGIEPPTQGFSVLCSTN